MGVTRGHQLYSLLCSGKKRIYASRLNELPWTSCREFFATTFETSSSSFTALFSPFLFPSAIMRNYTSAGFVLLGHYLTRYELPRIVSFPFFRFLFLTWFIGIELFPSHSCIKLDPRIDASVTQVSLSENSRNILYWY